MSTLAAAFVEPLVLSLQSKQKRGSAQPGFPCCYLALLPFHSSAVQSATRNRYFPQRGCFWAEFRLFAAWTCIIQSSLSIRVCLALICKLRSVSMFLFSAISKDWRRKILEKHVFFLCVLKTRGKKIKAPVPEGWYDYFMYWSFYHQHLVVVSHLLKGYHHLDRTKRQNEL